MRAAAAPLVSPRAFWLAAASAATGAAAVLYRYPPLEVHFYPRCPLFVLTGIYCPGCGALRAGHALLHGHLEAALGYNALLVVAAPFLAYAVVAQAYLALTGRSLPTYRLSGRETRAIAWVFILFMLLRNLPLYPFNLLAP